MYGSHYMRHTGFLQVDGGQRDPRDLGRHIDRFEHCRPVMSIDGTHLYRKYKGTLLIAMGCGGNNQLFPLTFAIIEGENIDN